MEKTYFVIWTTTTWTLPANEAICLNGQFEYSFVKIGDEFHIMATDLVKSVMDSSTSPITRWWASRSAALSSS